MDDVRNALRTMTRDHTNYTRWVVRFGNALKLRSDGENQKRPTTYFMTESYRNNVTAWLDDAKRQRSLVENEIRRAVHRLPIWSEWAANTNGVGELTIAYLESYVDLDRATDANGLVVVSKVWSFCGYGDPEKWTNAEGKRLFCAPVKKQLWTASDAVMKLRNTAPGPFSHIYDDLKNRLQNSDRIVQERVKGGKTRDVAWKDANGMHIENAVKRRISKEIIRQYTLTRAALEGRKVRPPYEEEHLNRRHSA